MSRKPAMSAMSKKLWHFLIYILILSLLSGGVYTGFYADAEVGGEMSADVPAPEAPAHWVSTYAAALIEAGIIDADEFAVAEYDEPITRGRFTDLFTRLLLYNGYVRFRFRELTTRYELGEDATIRILENDSEDNPRNGTGDNPGSSTGGPGSGAVFTDVEPGDDYYEPIRYAHDLEIINGFPDGSFRPETPIERQEIFTIIGRANDKGIMTNPGIGVKFDEKGRWVIRLTPPDSEPSFITGFADDGDIADYARPYVHLLAENEIIAGYQDNTIRPTAAITCAEAISLAERLRRTEPSTFFEQPLTRPDAPDYIRVPIITPKPSPTPTPKASPTPASTAAIGGGGGGSPGSGSAAVAT